MTFDQEWAQLVDSARRPSETTRMRLNHADPGDGGTGGSGTGKKDLDVTESVLRGRAGKADGIRTQFLQADDEVMTATGQVGGGIKGFATETALTAFQERWKDQMAYGKEQLGKAAKALRSAATSFKDEEDRRTKAFGGDGGSRGQGGGRN